MFQKHILTLHKAAKEEYCEAGEAAIFILY